MVRVLVNGAKGKMGTAAVNAISADPDLELTGTCDLGDDLRAKLKESRAEVCVEFTTAEAGYENTVSILESGVCPVVGTSGFTEEEVSKLRVLAETKKKGGLIAPNFAIGAVLMMKFSADAAKYLPRVEIVEAHHDRKADSPSGTALRTAELMRTARGSAIDKLPDTEIIPNARGASLEGIHIHSMRLPGVVAKQTVVFGGTGQTLTIEHNSLDRESFMPGVVLACKKVVRANELFYGLEYLL